MVIFYSYVKLPEGRLSCYRSLEVTAMTVTAMIVTPMTVTAMIVNFHFQGSLARKLRFHIFSHLQLSVFEGSLA